MQKVKILLNRPPESHAATHLGADVGRRHRRGGQSRPAHPTDDGSATRQVQAGARQG